jgi:hypothetical protein
MYSRLGSSTSTPPIATHCAQALSGKPQPQFSQADARPLFHMYIVLQDPTSKAGSYIRKLITWLAQQLM